MLTFDQSEEETGGPPDEGSDFQSCYDNVNVLVIAELLLNVAMFHRISPPLVHNEDVYIWEVNGVHPESLRDFLACVNEHNQHCKGRICGLKLGLLVNYIA